MPEAIPYRSHPGKMLLAVLFLGAGAATLGHKALTNDRGAIIYGLIELGPTGATTVHAGLAGLVALIVARGIERIVASVRAQVRSR